MATAVAGFVLLGTGLLGLGLVIMTPQPSSWAALSAGVTFIVGAVLLLGSAEQNS